MSAFTILGASGFIGGQLKRQLEAEGHVVFAPARGDSSIYSRPLGRVYYCIGMTADFAKNPAATVEAHAGIVSRLVETGNFDHLVYLSSTRLYDRIAQDEGRADTVLPIEPANPRHLYDISKLLGENLCLTAAAGRAAVARLSGVFGTSEDATGFLSEWAQRSAREKTFTLDSASGVVRDYIHIEDTLRALRTIVEQGACGVFNVASGVNLSNADIAEVFARRGWNVSLARETPRQSLPRCDIAPLGALGVDVRDPRAVIDAWLQGIRLEGISLS